METKYIYLIPASVGKPTAGVKVDIREIGQVLAISILVILLGLGISIALIALIWGDNDKH